MGLVALAVTAATGAAAAVGRQAASTPVNVQVFAPRPGDAVGKQSRGFLVDLAVQYPSLAASGADFQLTGPLTHQNQAPFPGAFAAGADEKLPGLIVLLSTSTVGARNAQNLANLFNLTAFTNKKTNEIWDTWIVGNRASARTSARCSASPSPPTRTGTGSTTTLRNGPRCQPRRPHHRRRPECVRHRLEHRRRSVRDPRLIRNHKIAPWPWATKPSHEKGTP